MLIYFIISLYFYFIEERLYLSIIIDDKTTLQKYNTYVDEEMAIQFRLRKNTGNNVLDDKIKQRLWTAASYFFV